MKNYEIDLTSSKNLLKNIIHVSLPLMLSGILQLLYNAADLIVCGKFGSEHSVAAIGSTMSLVGLFLNLFIGLSVGANIEMAKYYGLNNQEQGKKVCYTSIIYALIFGILIATIGITFSRRILEWMGSTSDVIDLSTDYLSILFLAAPFSLIFNFGSSILRATGDSKRSFIYLAVSGIVNVLLNLILVIYFNLDVKGVAIATAVSQFLSALLVVIALRKNKGFVYFRFTEIKFDKYEGKEILRIGIPSGLQSVVFSISNVMLQSSINSLGTLAMDGAGAANSLEGFIYTSMNAITQSEMPFISANKAVNNKKNIIKTMFISLIIIVIINLVLGGTIFLFKDSLLSLYLNNIESKQMAIGHLTSVIIVYFLCGWCEVFSFGQRAIGYSTIPMIVSVFTICGYRLLHIFFVFPLEAYHSLGGLMLCYPLSWGISLIFHFLCFIILFKNKV